MAETRPQSFRIDKEDQRLIDELRFLMELDTDTEVIHYALRALAMIEDVESNDVYARKLERRMEALAIGGE